MNALRRLTAWLVGWADDTVAGRRALAQERIRSRLLEDRLRQLL